MLQHVSVLHHNMVVSSNQNDLQVIVNLSELGNFWNEEYKNPSADE